MNRFFTAATSALLLAGCASNYDAAPCHTLCQRCKPQVAVVPIVNRANTNLAWDVSKELTNDILDSVMDRSLLWVTPLAQNRAAIDKTTNYDLFGKDLSYANYFSSNDYLVIMELVRHDTHPFSKERFPHIDIRRAPECHSVVSMAVRLRVLDLRHEEPMIVMQEVVEAEQILTNRAAKIDYTAMDVESAEYQNTPMAHAHMMLAREVSDKMECTMLSNW